MKQRLTETECGILRRTLAMIDAQLDEPTGAGYCGIGALIVHYVLGNKSYQLMGSSGHWWVERRSDRAVLDPTANQFSMKDRLYEYERGKGCSRATVIIWYQTEYDAWGKQFQRRLRSQLRQT